METFPALHTEMSFGDFVPVTQFTYVTTSTLKQADISVTGAPSREKDVVRAKSEFLKYVDNFNADESRILLSSSSVDVGGAQSEGSLDKGPIRSEAPPSVTKKKHIQMWYGSVRSVAGETFLSRLVDPSGFTPDIDAEMPIAYIEDEEAACLEPGAVFYLNVSLVADEYGRKSTVTNIRFRRLAPKDKYDENLERQYLQMFETLERKTPHEPKSASS